MTPTRDPKQYFWEVSGRSILHWRLYNTWCSIFAVNLRCTEAQAQLHTQQDDKEILITDENHEEEMCLIEAIRWMRDWPHRWIENLGNGPWPWTALVEVWYLDLPDLISCLVDSSSAMSMEETISSLSGTKLSRRSGLHLFPERCKWRTTLILLEKTIRQAGQWLESA